MALAISLRFMLLVGEVNLGVGAFFGFGAYTAALLSLRLGAPTAGSDPRRRRVGGRGIDPIRYLTLRVSGHYFMLVSFALTEIARLVYTQSPLLGGNSGLVGIVPDLPGFPYIVLGIVVAIYVVLVALERSHLGRMFAAISENAAYRPRRRDFGGGRQAALPRHLLLRGRAGRQPASPTPTR